MERLLCVRKSCILCILLSDSVPVSSTHLSSYSCLCALGSLLLHLPDAYEHWDFSSLGLLGKLHPLVDQKTVHTVIFCLPWWLYRSLLELHFFLTLFSLTHISFSASPGLPSSQATSPAGRHLSFYSIAAMIQEKKGGGKKEKRREPALSLEDWTSKSLLPSSSFFHLLHFSSIFLPYGNQTWVTTFKASAPSTPAPSAISAETQIVVRMIEGSCLKWDRQIRNTAWLDSSLCERFKIISSVTWADHNHSLPQVGCQDSVTHLEPS